MLRCPKCLEEIHPSGSYDDEDEDGNMVVTMYSCLKCENIEVQVIDRIND